MPSLFNNPFRRKSLKPRSVPGSKRRVQPSLEALEDRLVPANIVWTNQGSDGFEVYNNLPAVSQTMTNAQVARAIVNEAIHDWETLIRDFGTITTLKPGKGLPTETKHLDEFRVAINAQNLANEPNSPLGQGLASRRDVHGKPYEGWVRLGDNGNGGGWILDATPGQPSEFAALSPFAGTGGPDRSDLYTAVLHELGHCLGMDHVDAGSYPNDLMVDNLPKGTRRLISN